MTFDEFMQKVQEMFPDSLVAENGDGELVVHTGMQVVEDQVLPMPSK